MGTPRPCPLCSLKSVSPYARWRDPEAPYYVAFDSYWDRITWGDHDAVAQAPPPVVGTVGLGQDVFVNPRLLMGSWDGEPQPWSKPSPPNLSAWGSRWRGWGPALELWSLGPSQAFEDPLNLTSPSLPRSSVICLGSRRWEEGCLPPWCIRLTIDPPTGHLYHLGSSKFILQVPFQGRWPCDASSLRSSTTPTIPGTPLHPPKGLWATFWTLLSRGSPACR